MTVLSSEQTNAEPLRGRVTVFVWGVLAIFVGVAISGFIGIRAPHFADLYSGFGDYLLAPTRFVLGWWYLLWALPIAALAMLVAALRWRESAGALRQASVLLVSLCVLEIVIGVLAMLALYAPIFFMGQPV